MPRAPAPPWKRRLEPIMDAHLRASVDRANGQYDENGNYALLVYAGCESRDRADEIRRALFRSRRYVGVSCAATVVPADDGTYQVHYFAINPAHAKKYVLEKYGTDRSRWAYDPRAKGKE